MVVYGLGDPRLQDVRYVGRTCNKKPKDRLAAHLWHARECNKTHVQKWITKLVGEGVRPDMFIVEALSPSSTLEELDEAERFWISYFRMLGAKLTNATDGGEGWATGKRNPMHDPVARAKFSASNKGRKLTGEHRKNIGDGHRHMSLEFVKRQAEMLAARNRTNLMRVNPNNRRAAKLTVEQVKSIRARHLAGELIRDLAVEFGMCVAAISALVNRHTWKHV